jgi:sugar phosphate isomerase/epimerase
MLEPSDPGWTDYINTMQEAMAWVDRIGSPAFTVMMDTYELVACELSIAHGIRAAHRRANHFRTSRFELDRQVQNGVGMKSRLHVK